MTPITCTDCKREIFDWDTVPCGFGTVLVLRNVDMAVAERLAKWLGWNAKGSMVIMLRGSETLEELSELQMNEAGWYRGKRRNSRKKP